MFGLEIGDRRGAQLALFALRESSNRRLKVAAGDLAWQRVGARLQAGVALFEMCSRAYSQWHVLVDASSFSTIFDLGDNTDEKIVDILKTIIVERQIAQRSLT